MEIVINIFNEDEFANIEFLKELISMKYGECFIYYTDFINSYRNKKLYEENVLRKEEIYGMIVSTKYLGESFEQTYTEESILYEIDYSNGEYLFYGIKRNDLDLVELCKKYNTGKVIDIPDDVNWYITESEMGGEYISERHRTWS